MKYRVLITGSTKGLGRALAASFLDAGDTVLVTSRDGSRVSEAVKTFQAKYGNDRIYGTTADVSRADSVKALVAYVEEHMGGIDIWINNAGSNGYTYENLQDSDPGVLQEIVLTNSLGSLLCCREAIRLMSAQKDGGHIFLMEGAGSDGNSTKKYAAYGHTKAGMAQLSKSLMDEVSNVGVGVHTISPGMVFTELISSGRYAFGSQGRFFVNALAEPADVAAGEIVGKVREVVREPKAKEKPQAIKVLTPDVALKKIFSRLILQQNKDRYYPEDDPKDK